MFDNNNPQGGFDQDWGGSGFDTNNGGWDDNVNMNAGGGFQQPSDIQYYNNNSFPNPAPSNGFQTFTPAAPSPYDPNFGSPKHGPMGGSFNGSDSMSQFDDEIPLLEELGINFSSIWSKTRAVHTSFSALDESVKDDCDLAGPLIFVLILGFFLLLAGKVHFGYIYGFGLVGCLLMYLILNLMSANGISFDRTTSILGYSLLPLDFLAAVAVVFNIRGPIGFGLAMLCIGWCTLTATRFIEVALNMRSQRYLVAYPVTLLYSCFALLTVF